MSEYQSEEELLKDFWGSFKKAKESIQNLSYQRQRYKPI
jgi:hypothetical protein